MFLSNTNLVGGAEKYDLSESPPLRIWADDVRNGAFSSLIRYCTPSHWDDNEKVSPVFHSVLIQVAHRPQGEAQPCSIDARALTVLGQERIVRGEGLCLGDGFDLVDHASDVFKLLHDGDDARITVTRQDESDSTFFAPPQRDYRAAATWLHNVCGGLRESAGRITVPGPLHGAWHTEYIYDEIS